MWQELSRAELENRSVADQGRSTAVSVSYMDAFVAINDVGAPAAADSSDSDGDSTLTMKELGDKAKIKYFPLHSKVNEKEPSKKEVKKAYIKWRKAAFTQKVLMTCRLACKWPKMMAAIRMESSAVYAAASANIFAQLMRRPAAASSSSGQVAAGAVMPP